MSATTRAPVLGLFHKVLLFFWVKIELNSIDGIRFRRIFVKGRFSKGVWSLLKGLVGAEYTHLSCIHGSSLLRTRSCPLKVDMG